MRGRETTGPASLPSCACPRGLLLAIDDFPAPATQPDLPADLPGRLPQDDQSFCRVATIGRDRALSSHTWENVIDLATRLGPATAGGEGVENQAQVDHLKAREVTFCRLACFQQAHAHEGVCQPAGGARGAEGKGRQKTSDRVAGFYGRWLRACGPGRGIDAEHFFRWSASIHTAGAAQAQGAFWIRGAHRRRCRNEGHLLLDGLLSNRWAMALTCRAAGGQPARVVNMPLQTGA